ncbi:MAG: hypothetical protein GY929_27650 [Actinomycetia bacterium]|nr:hypothetical protein [Actinomycetes bacterium]
MVSLGPRLKRSPHGLQTRGGPGRAPARWHHAPREVDLPGHGTLPYDRLRVRFMPGGSVRKRQWYFNDANDQPSIGVRGFVTNDEVHLSVDGGRWLSLYQGPESRGVVEELVSQGIEEYLNDGQELL